MASIVRKNRACSGTSCADARDTSAAHAGLANRVRRRIGSRMPGLPNRKRARMSAAETGVSGLPCAGLVLDGPDLVARRARRSRKTSDAIPRGESLPCVIRVDPTPSPAHRCTWQMSSTRTPTRRGTERSDDPRGDGFPASRRRAASGQCQACARGPRGRHCLPRSASRTGARVASPVQPSSSTRPDQ
jgi:hypothetical protein